LEEGVFDKGIQVAVRQTIRMDHVLSALFGRRSEKMMSEKTMIQQHAILLDVLGDELLVLILGRCTVRNVFLFRAAGRWSRTLVEGKSFEGLWKTSFRITFQTAYLALVLDDNREWFKDFVEKVEQNPGRKRTAMSVIPAFESFGRKTSLLLRSEDLCYWTLKCFDGDAVIDIKKRIAATLNVPLEDQKLTVRVQRMDDIGDMVVDDVVLEDTMQVTLDLVGEYGMVSLISSVRPSLSSLSSLSNTAGENEELPDENWYRRLRNRITVAWQEHIARFLRIGKWKSQVPVTAGCVQETPM